jgi:hypothetical protein
MSRIRPQLICFSYHKSGTSLFLHVMTKVGQRLGRSLVNHYGLVQHLAVEPDIVLLPHSLLRAPLDRPYRAIRLIRDPRDIWVSGYLYHRRCDETWCRNTDLDPTPPITWPRVDYSIAHRPEDWKQRYLAGLGGRSYQQNLLDRSTTDGLDFELRGYTGRTLETMRQWPLNGADALNVKLEDVMADFDGSMLRIFEHFGFTAGERQAALEAARPEDVRRMDDVAIAERPQIHSRTISKWRAFLSPAQVMHFETCHGDLIRDLGYVLTVAGDPVPAVAGATPRILVAIRDDAAGPQTTVGAMVRLSADGAVIRPSAVSRDTYHFVVPAGRERVRLESCSHIPTDPSVIVADERRRLGVRVSRIAIRSDAGEAVIAPDDPRLGAGWHEAERAGTALWRWTNGSGEIPWSDAVGPAEVSVSCITLAAYPNDNAGTGSG